MLTLLTTTGARPEAWALCERWMARQDYAGPVRWVIVDDGEQPQPVSFERAGWVLQSIRPKHRWQPGGQNTQRENLLAGLSVIGADERVAIIEDDDHYAPQWLSIVAEGLDRAELVGNAPNRYYNVKSGRAILHTNTRHASLCATAMRGDALKEFRRLVERGWRIYDISLWRQSNLRSKELIGGNFVTGIKGMPGRAGIASGHGLTEGDPAKLSHMIGGDAEAYEQFR